MKKNIWTASNSMMNRKATYCCVISLALIFSITAVTLGIVWGKKADSEESSVGRSAFLSNTVEPSGQPIALTMSPSFRPSLRSSLFPSTLPSHAPSATPSTEAPSAEPTQFELDFNFTLFPSNTSAPSEDSTESPSLFPSPSPSELLILVPEIPATPSPSPAPSELLILVPELPATPSPTIASTSASPTILVDERMATPAPISKDNEPPDEIGTRFYAIGDVPYTNRESNELKVQIEELQKDAEFLIHVGDIRSARDGSACVIEEYHAVADILNKSHAPVFIVLGDNEWNDCPNVNQGFDHWMTVFGMFEDQWDHAFNVRRLETRPENFAFVHKKTLFFGLNLVGGLLHHTAQWEERLTDLFEWVRDEVDVRVISNQEARSVVIFGHADPTGDHADFFDPLSEYLRDEQLADVPFLYLNGDAHKWNYKENFFGRSNLLRMQVEGSTREPPLQVTVHNNAIGTKKPSEVFQYDRMLSLLAI